ncbi:MAG: tRNA pseudouridine(55) synthase TruB [Patescibacteria group bacterium]|nr:tRNA pseudouridine(55) synthase TruB [Patescibacteria group bacterium]
MQGIHSIYKPKGPSSHQIINELRKITQIKTIGHAGTLDPMASGILVVGIGRWAVKKIWSNNLEEKEYLAQIKLGEKSNTDDKTGQIKKLKNIPKPDIKDVKKALKNFKGNIKQKPPDFSAIKIKGQRAYKISLQGKKPPIKKRLVNIKNIKLINYKWPFLDLKIITGPGVYIRSLARDLGEILDTGGVLYKLERTRVGKFIKKNSYTLTAFKKEYQKRKMDLTLCPIIKNNKILLGMKKRGFGQGRWNGFGGKLKPGENIRSSLIREIKEECEIFPKKINQRGLFIFEFENNPEILHVHLFDCPEFQGKPKETEEMKPKWFDFDKIPYKKMWPDDKFWLPLFLKGKNLKGVFYFKDKDNLLDYSLKEIK